MRRLLSFTIAILFLSCSPARASNWLIPPVDGPVARAFEAPSTTWGPGHRGIDLSVTTGTRVRAAGPGTVTFAGRVADTLAITIRHDGPLQTTYSRLSDIWVRPGQPVQAGTWLGVVGDAHPGVAGLHFGVKVGGDYADPARFLVALDPSDAIHLAPLALRYSDVLPEMFGKIYDSAGSHERSCVEVRPGWPVTAPNDNVAVAVAGIGSRTWPSVNAAMYEPGLETLGYERVYEFSYRGVDGPNFHEPYRNSDTFEDLRAAAGKLGDLLRKVRKRHPEDDVDLIAHSQGGVVARTYLQEEASPSDRGLPFVEHVVTFSTPHEGAAIAGARPVIERSATGRLALAVASAWANDGGRVPDPYGASVVQMTPGSDLLEHLATEDVAYGTRALALAIPNDVVVTADAARWDGQRSVMVPPTGLYGHNDIVTAPAALATAHRFLRDGAVDCAGGWDEWGPRIGTAIGWGERALAHVVDHLLP